MTQPNRKRHNISQHRLSRPGIVEPDPLEHKRQASPAMLAALWAKHRMCTQNILGICTAEDLSRNLRVQPARWHITDRLARQASQLSGRRDSNVVFAWTCKCQFAHRCNIAQWNERAFTESTSTTSNRCDLNRFWWEILCCISVKQNTVL